MIYRMMLFGLRKSFEKAPESYRITGMSAGSTGGVLGLRMGHRREAHQPTRGWRTPSRPAPLGEGRRRGAHPSCLSSLQGEGKKGAPPPLSFPPHLYMVGGAPKEAALGLSPHLLGSPRGCLLPSHTYIYVGRGATQYTTYSTPCVGTPPPLVYSSTLDRRSA